MLNGGVVNMDWWMEG